MAAKNGSKVPVAESQDVALKVPNILEEANALVHGARNADYGHPADDFAAVAKAFNAYVEKKYNIANLLEATDVPIFQMVVKIMREANKPKRDNLVDIAGYAATLEMVHDAQGRD